jgi:hypothetical protein
MDGILKYRYLILWRYNELLWEAVMDLQVLQQGYISWLEENH